jgi:hypothetical protein
MLPRHDTENARVLENRRVYEAQGCNDALFDPEGHAAMLEDYARKPEAVIRLAFVAAVILLVIATARRVLS